MTPSQPPQLLLTVEEASRALRVGRAYLYRLIARGALASVRVGRSRRVPVSALHEYVAALLEAQAE